MKLQQAALESSECSDERAGNQKWRGAQLEHRNRYGHDRRENALAAHRGEETGERSAAVWRAHGRHRTDALDKRAA